MLPRTARRQAEARVARATNTIRLLESRNFEQRNGFLCRGHLEIPVSTVIDLSLSNAPGIVVELILSLQTKADVGKLVSDVARHPQVN